MTAPTPAGPTPRTIGPVTTGAAVGGVSANAVGQALAEIIVFSFPGLEPISNPISVLITSVLTLVGILLGGYLVRSPEPDTPATREAVGLDGVVE